MSQFVRHIAGPFEERQQFCIICGYKICDYRNAFYLSGDGAPLSGFKEGELWIQGKNPTSFFTSLDGILEDEDTVIDCNKLAP